MAFVDVELFAFSCRELLSGYRDVTFIPSQASFPTFHKNCDSCESPGITTCPITVSGVRQVHAP